MQFLSRMVAVGRRPQQHICPHNLAHNNNRVVPHSLWDGALALAVCIRRDPHGVPGHIWGEIAGGVTGWKFSSLETATNCHA